jgi:aspartate aminotransferase
MLKNMNPQFVETARLEYLRRRNALCDALARVDGISFRPPEGAFYTLVSIPGVDAEAFCTRLLANFSHDGETVFLAPASGFYITPNTGRSLIRIAFVLAESEITRAIHIVDRALQTKIDQTE